MESQSLIQVCEEPHRPAVEATEAQNSGDNEVGRTLGDGQEEVMDNTKKCNSQVQSDVEEITRNNIMYSIKSECTDAIDCPEKIRMNDNILPILNNSSTTSCSNDFINEKSNKELIKFSDADLPDETCKLTKAELTEQDSTNANENDLLATDINSVSISLSEDRSDVHYSGKGENCSMSNIFSLLRVWSDGSSHRLKNLEHAALIMKNLLCEHLPGFASKETIPDTPECLLILLQDCLSQYQGMISTLKSRQRELELELEESRRTGTERYHVLVEEHKERLSRVFQDHEQQLTAAVERAINSRRQAGSLHAQLALAQAKIEQLEIQRKESTESILVEHKRKLNDLQEEKQVLLAKIEQFKDQMKIKDAEIKAIEEGNRDLKTKNKAELAQEQKYLKALEKKLATEITTTTILQNELKQERQHNQELWLETDRRAQELAALQCKLETNHHEILHKDCLLQMLREEILEKFSSDYHESLDHSSLFSDSGMSFNWLTSIKQQISNTNAEIKEKSNMLAQKELTLTDIEAELRRKELKLEDIKEEQCVTDVAFKQLSEELNKKKEQINKLALHNKKVEKKIIAILEQSSEKNKLLQSLKEELEETNSQFEQMMLKLKEGKLKIKDMELKISTSEQFNKQLADKFKFNKKQEELLKNRCLLKQNQIDHLLKVLESKNKIIINLEQHLTEKDSQLTSFISTEGNALEPNDINSYMNTANDYIFPVKKNDKTLSVIKKPNSDKEQNSFCSNATNNIIEITDNQSSDNKINQLVMQKTDKRNTIKENQGIKCTRRLDKFYSPSKLSHSDSGHISGSTLASPLSVFSPSSELVSRDVFLNNNQSVSPDSLKFSNIKQNKVSCHTTENDKQPHKETSCTYNHIVTPAKANSPLTVNINLQPPSVQTQQAHQNSESERMFYNVAIDMKTLTPSKQHKVVDSSYHGQKKNSMTYSNKNVINISGCHPTQIIPDCGMDSLPNTSSKQSYYPTASTPVSKCKPIHKLVHTDSGFTVFSDSCTSEQEERLPVEGGEQT